MEPNFSIISLTAIAVLGLIISKIKIKGIGLGISSVFLAGLIGGYFGLKVDRITESFGLLLFMAVVGNSSGRTFRQTLKETGGSYILLSFFMALMAFILSIISIHLLRIDSSIVLGAMTGAYTSSPAFSEARIFFESKKDLGMLSASYGFVYPIAVVIKVIFVQIIPKLVKNIDPLKISYREISEEEIKNIDPDGIFQIVLSILIGVLLGSLKINIKSVEISLGSTAGVLITALFFGHVIDKRKLPFEIPVKSQETVKNLGLTMFFAGAGADGGLMFVEVLKNYGLSLFFIGIMFLLVPLFLGFFLAVKILKKRVIPTLSALSACTTCTPSLAVLLEKVKSDEIVGVYAEIYPFALIFMIIVIKLIGIFGT